MRHRHVIGIAAVAIDAERIRLDRAHVLVAAETGRTLAAAEPGIGQRDVADRKTTLVGVLDVRPERDDLADRLVAHRARQRDAAVLQRQRLTAVAEIIAAFPDVQVRVADAGGLDLDQHLRARRLRRRLIDLLQRRVEIDDLEALHRCSPESLFLRRTLPRLSRQDKRGLSYLTRFLPANRYPLRSKTL